MISDTIELLVIDTTTNQPKTGDAANLTAHLSIDGGAFADLTDTSATEVDATKAKGLYRFSLTVPERTGEKWLFSGSSTTSGVAVVPREIRVVELDSATTTKIDDILTDTGTTLPAQISGITAGSGSGARTVTITVDDGTTALQNATVRMTEGVNTFTALTNVSGVAVFNLDDATYTVGLTKAGYTYAGTTLLVNGTEAATYSMTVVSITPPTDPALCAVVFHLRDQYGADKSGEPVEITFVKWETGAAETPPVVSVPPVQTTDADGLVEVELYRDATYRIVYGSAGYARRVDVIVPDALSYTVEI